MTQRRVLLIEKLSEVSLWQGLAYRLMGRRVFVIDYAQGTSGRAITRRARAYGFEPFPYGIISEIDYFRKYETARRLTLNLIADYDLDFIIARLRPHFPVISEFNKKLRATIFKSWCSHIIGVARAIDLADQLSNAGMQPVIAPSQIAVSRAVLSRFGSPYRSHLIAAIGTVCRAYDSAAATFHFARRSIVRRLDAKQMRTLTRSQATPNSEPSGKVLFFPVSGLAYGELFLKDQYYAEDPASPYHRSQILHVEYQPISSRAREIYDELGLSWEMLPRQKAEALRTVVGAALDLARRSPLKLLNSGIFSVLRILGSIANFYAGLKAYPNARVALVGYDYLFPAELTLALQAHYIKVIATQERFGQPFIQHFSAIFDYYFVAGAAVVDRLAANPFFAARKVVPIGLIRSEWIAVPSLTAAKKLPKLVLVLDYHSDSDIFQANDGIPAAWANNKVFYEHIISVALRFPDHRFVLRGKDAAWIHLQYFSDIVAQMATIPNLRCDSIQEFRRTYHLASEADLVIARHTSLGDEALAVGKPVFFYERDFHGSRIFSQVNNYQGLPVFVHTLEDLIDRVSRVLCENEFIAEPKFNEVRRYFFSADLPGNPRTRLRAELDKLLTEGAPIDAAQKMPVVSDE